MLRLLEPHEINQVLHANFDIWAPGLDRSRYRHYQWWQLRSPWGRRHISYLGYFSESNELQASCKLYRFEYQAHSRFLKVGGIGAVFVDKKHRGRSYGLKMLELLAEECRAQGYDALILNSDIDPEYYEKLGYYLFDYETFSVDLSDQFLRASIRHLDSISDPHLNETFSVRPVENPDFAEMCRHHGRWLANQKFGLKRSTEYWQYKIDKERYLQKHSKLNWPRQDIVTDNYGQFTGGYALVEQSGRFLRVLEVIGPERVRNSLWSQIFSLAQRRQIKTVRGWSIMAPPVKGLNFHMRDWSYPMICPLKEELVEEVLDWTDLEPPPILELDHF